MAFSCKGALKQVQAFDAFGILMQRVRRVIRASRRL
jgi:hypothetical protein